MAIEVLRAGSRAPKRSALRLPFRAPRPQTFGTTDRMFFTERLALLLEAGVPLHTCLASLEEQAASVGTRSTIAALRKEVTEGQSFSHALLQQSEAFPATYASLVAAGERGGFLPKVLERLHALDERSRELRAALVSALTYPAFLIALSFAVIVFVLVVVFPKFSALFSMIHDQLPLTTRFLLALSDGMRRHWLPLLVGVPTASALAWHWLHGPRGALALERAMLRIPPLRDLFVQLQLVRLLQVMSLSLEHGVPVVEALHACRGVVRGVTLGGWIQELERGVREGRGLARGFQDAQFLPALARQMVVTGEEAGNLAMVMSRLADFYEREWRRRIATAAKLIEPVMLLVMGVVVGLIVSSLILPIFKLSRAVH